MLPLLVQFRKPLLKPCGKFVGTLAGQPGIEPGIGPARQLLLFQLDGTVIPIIDFLGKPFLDGGFGLVNEDFLAAAHLVQMRRDEIQGSVFQHLRFKFLPQPSRFRHLSEQGQFVLGRAVGS